MLILDPVRRHNFNFIHISPTYTPDSMDEKPPITPFRVSAGMRETAKSQRLLCLRKSCYSLGNM
jgi:hypothetical protein